MNDKPKSIWKKSWQEPHWLREWLILVVATFLVTFVIGVLTGYLLIDWSWSEWVLASAFSLITGFVVATFVIGVAALIRWFFSKKNFKRTLFALACFITLIALFYAEEDWRGRHDWEKFKQQWKAKGERFDYASTVPPPVPDDQNFAMAPIWPKLIEVNIGTNLAEKLYGTNFVEQEPVKDADRLQMSVGDWENYNDWPTNGNWERSTLTDLRPWQNYYRALAATTNLFPVAPQPQTPAQDVLLALSKYDSAIEELRAASERTDSRFPLDYNDENPVEIMLPHLGILKRCAQVLELRAIAELQNGQSDKAFDDIQLGLQLIDKVQTEPFIITHLVRIAILDITLQPIYEGLAEHKWSDAQLAELDSELAKLDFLADYGRSVHAEAVAQAKIIDYLEQKRSRFNDVFNFFGDENDSQRKQMNQLSVIAAVYLGPKGWFDQNKITVLQMNERWNLPIVDDAQQIVSPQKAREADQAFQSLRGSPFKFLALPLAPMLWNYAERAAYGQNSANMARIAIALEHYRLAHGNFPDSLDALAPQFMETIPHEIINGQPLHYRLTDDGQFVLYSVGWNETDDGGIVVLKNGSNARDEGMAGVDIAQGDWVWRYPDK
ncbi:MAG TPA: hypothetical protein VMD27_01805 [Candidatus Aquilonibacter sp.]|nr:hypothetical protein [Candidatus Aquilonibacter sp.]